MIRRNAAVAIAVLACVLAGLGCNSGPVAGLVGPLIFPWEGQLGDTGAGTTAAIVIDSNYSPLFDIRELHNLHTDRVNLLLADAEPGGADWVTPVSVPARSVFSLEASPGSLRHELQPGSVFTVALFDLPNKSALPPGGFPYLAEIRVEIDGMVTVAGEFLITGDEGEPDLLADETVAGFQSLQETLEPQWAARLRGKRGATSEVGLFYEGQPPIASVEFDFEYTTLCIDNIRAYPATEASDATAYVGPPVAVPSQSERVHVVMVDPEGFDLVFPENVQPGGIDNADETLAGTGPMIDVAFDRVPGACGLDVTNPAFFRMTDLLVTAADGTTLVEVDGVVVLDTNAAPDAQNAVFRLYGVEGPDV